MTDGHTYPPNRISDLVKLKQQGFDVTCFTYFEIVPLDVENEEKSYKAFIFLCQYGGTVDGEDYGFRKCYARACSDKQCDNIYQAVMTARTYATTDYNALEQAGILLDKRRMTLAEVVKKFEGMQDEYRPIQTIQDYVDKARAGQTIRIEHRLNYISAQEYVSDYKIQMIFLMVAFTITGGGEIHKHERCYACYPKDQEALEKQDKMNIANARLKILYNKFDQVSIKHEKLFY